MEEQLIIPAGEVTLEARFIAGAAPAGAVITHPHPLYGGSMNNNVVWTATRALGERGWSTLRVNFRGVGASTGSYGGGLAETADVAAALAFLQSRAPGPGYVVGYSFGAAVAARALLEGWRPRARCSFRPPSPSWTWPFSPKPPGST
jgi:uncharacterized protein